ncbi:hypothetical protein ACFPOH_12905 [Ureibacillus suwonensis]|uniref:HD domain-containing protein n=1 Tax=Ureibacillus suwonensis TaxID=313007 RepID=A0ABW0RGK6_9BACL
MNKYIVAFFLFSFLGWVWESIYCTIRGRKWANRGFLYGPICPIYGCGSLLGYFLFDLIKNGYVPDLDWWMIFILGFIASMVLEYPTSWILEKLFKARWWDYSRYPLNINGRTSVPTSIGFGAAAILLMKCLIPLADQWLTLIPETVLNILALILVSMISIDTTLTVSSLTDFQKRVSSIDEAFQHRMTDIVSRVYNYQTAFFNKAIQRIVVFELPERKSRIAKHLREKQFIELIKDYYNSDMAGQMDKNFEHGATTTREHCENVAWISYLINEKLHLNANEKELVEAAMLHDLFLHQWKTGDASDEADHGMAGNHAEKWDNETLRSHMWPIKISKIPKSREAMIIYFADKYCTLIETIRMNKRFGLRN